MLLIAVMIRRVQGQEDHAGTRDKVEGREGGGETGWTEDRGPEQRRRETQTHHCYHWTRYRSETLMIPPGTSKHVLNRKMSKPEMKGSSDP